MRKHGNFQSTEMHAHKGLLVSGTCANKR